MQRHPSLISLSRDHHLALQLAEGLKRDGPDGLRAALPADLSERVARVISFISESLEPHFALEESLIFPAARGRDAELDALIERILGEHALLRGLFQKLAAPGDAEETLDALGRALVEHVRLEERALFTRIEALVPAAELDALAARIELSSRNPRGAGGRP
jgi:hemerythrin-like domain-containing protein